MGLPEFTPEIEMPNDSTPQNSSSGEISTPSENIELSAPDYNNQLPELSDLACFLRSLKSMHFDIAMENYATLTNAKIPHNSAKSYLKTMDEFRLGLISLNEGIRKLEHLNIPYRQAQEMLSRAKPKNTLKSFFNRIF